MLGTFVDLIETLKSVEVEPLHQLDELDGGGDQRLDRVLALELVQVLGQRAGVDADAHRRARGAWPRSATSATFSGPPMLPGLRRMQCAPASIAFSASVWLKWMSAITGIGDSRDDRLERLDVLARAARRRGRCRRRPRRRVRIWSIVAAEVGGLGLGHRLHGDGRAAADRDVPDPDLPLGGHAVSVRGLARAGRRWLAPLHRRREPGMRRRTRGLLLAQRWRPTLVAVPDRAARPITRT